MIAVWEEVSFGGFPRRCAFAPMARLRVFQIAKLVTRDIDPSHDVEVSTLDAHINKMLAAATDALKTPVAPYSDLEIGSIKQIYEGMKHSHATVRQLLGNGQNDPRSVDALAISRLQLETLYSLCLIFEQPGFTARFVKNGWKKPYIRFLLQREESRNLKRFGDVVQQLEEALEGLRRQAGVTDEEKMTVEYEELGKPLPPGFVPSAIQRFPLPSVIISLVRDPTTVAMLQRFYPEYEYLCNFTHSSMEGWLVRTMLDHRSPYRRLLEEQAGEQGIEKVFMKQVALPAMLYSFIGVAQACAELTRLYPNSYDLLAKTVEGWEWLIEDSLLGCAIWERRTRALLHVLSQG